MSAYRNPKTLVIGVVFACAMFLPVRCLAQVQFDNRTGEPKVEPGACQDLVMLPKLPGTVIVSCDKADSTEVVMPLKPDAQGRAREKSVHGPYLFREYKIADAGQQESAFDHLMQLLVIKGFTVKYSSGPSIITARNQDIWILLNINGEYYDVKAVLSKEDPWAPVKDAREISREMEAHQRVAIYGIQFSPDNQMVVEEKSKILAEVLAYLKGNPALTVDVESHKMTRNGSPEDDQEITEKRAKAVVGWLTAHGIAAERLRPKALGQKKPITENDTPLEVQKNERIELAKSTP